ncbi:MAG: SIR2 family protein [bacterium]
MTVMKSTTHDPREHIRGIHQILISDKKRIGFLFGAGTSFATGLATVNVPTIAKMTELIVSELKKLPPPIPNAIDEIEKEIGADHFTVESLLSTIEAKRAVIASGKLNGLTAEKFSELSKAMKSHVKTLVSIHSAIKPDETRNLSHFKLASWVSKARRSFPAELFTTNYDYLFEIALETLGIPYFDGFSGSYEPFFCPEAVEDIKCYPQLVKLWKLHGSLGWIYRDADKSVRRINSATDDDILIYPSHLKYNTSKKQPYVGLIDRLCDFLQQDDSVLITCGYSFGDNHINERIGTSLRRGANSQVIAMYYDEVCCKNNEREYALAKPDNHVRSMATHETGGKMSAYGMRHAVIGGKFGEWQLRDEPRADEAIRVSQYFDEDASIPSDNAGEQTGNERWEGTGRFILPDFCKLAEFLNSLSTSEQSFAPVQ